MIDETSFRILSYINVFHIQGHVVLMDLVSSEEDGRFGAYVRLTPVPASFVHCGFVHAPARGRSIRFFRDMEQLPVNTVRRRRVVL